jgi:hypothetical protein
VAVTPVAETNEAAFDGRLLTQPGYPEKVVKHLQLRYLENSPAKDTPGMA